ncbi:hypothetical protein PF010_g21232 [Phytophthora fragariae]|nr:hypothetical protein PF009_g14986 [Phytophthora fragariae]KAE8984922.1 hypothetical protein PF011_g20596 [Phytophthora fragariae]KAE9083396.1 hypothetical protein PF010_g21232 [Phytophthora fragariae]KAE9225429.1 hypothetical protein PF002_g14407 [Phytophthora fragariae]
MTEHREENRREELDQYPAETNDKRHIHHHEVPSFGRRSTFTAKDVFFTTIAVKKYGGSWEMLSTIFIIKMPTFIKTITAFIEVVFPKIHEEWVPSQAA